MESGLLRNRGHLQTLAVGLCAAASLVAAILFLAEDISYANRAAPTTPGEPSATGAEADPSAVVLLALLKRCCTALALAGVFFSRGLPRHVHDAVCYMVPLVYLLFASGVALSQLLLPEIIIIGRHQRWMLSIDYAFVLTMFILFLYIPLQTRRRLPLSEHYFLEDPVSCFAVWTIVLSLFLHLFLIAAFMIGTLVGDIPPREGFNSFIALLGIAVAFAQWTVPALSHKTMSVTFFVIAAWLGLTALRTAGVGKGSK